MAEHRTSIGFPQMREEVGERRAFLPHFIQQLVKIGYEVFLEKEYGLMLDSSFEDYKAESHHVHSVSREEVYKQDYVLILRCPHKQDFDLVGTSSCLMSMLHFPTRPKRTLMLEKKGIKTISLDSIVNDFQIRLVENMKAVAWNGLETVFGELEKKNKHLLRPDAEPWRVLIMGTGLVGKQAVDAATKFGRRDWNEEHIENSGAGVVVTSIGRNVTQQKDKMLTLLHENHIIVDCTQRRDASKPIIPNEWLALSQPDAIITDLSVDPYTLDADPRVVKGVEGIPQGNLDQYVFEADDPQWDALVPNTIPSHNRRKTVSCYSWPGIYPKKCMRLYGQQLLPLMRVLYKKNYDTLSSDGPHFERALYRARLATFLEKQQLPLPVQP